MKNNPQIPFLQIPYFVVIIILIGLRVFADNLSQYVNLANYISMLVAVSGVWISAIMKSHNDRNKNICKAVFAVFLFIAVAAGFYVFVSGIQVSARVNDVFTLVALLFCLCNMIFEYIIKGIFSLSYRDS